MSTPVSTPPQPAPHLSRRRPFCLTEDSPITGIWITTIRGLTYELAHDGRLQPAQRIGAAMSTAHLDQIRENRQRDVTRAVHAELLQLAIRRMEHRTEEHR